MQTRRRSSIASSNANQNENGSSPSSMDKLVTSSGRTSVPTAKAAQSPIRGRAGMHRKVPENQPNDDQPQQQSASTTIDQSKMPPTGSGRIRLPGRNPTTMSARNDETGSTISTSSSFIGREQTGTPDTPHGSPLANQQTAGAKRFLESDIKDSTPASASEPQTPSTTPARDSETPTTSMSFSKRPRLDEVDPIPAGTTTRIVRRIPMLSAPSPNIPSLYSSPTPAAPTPPPFGGFGTPQSQFAPVPPPQPRPTPSPHPTSRSAASSFTERNRLPSLSNPARFIKPTLPPSSRTPLSARTDNALPVSPFFDFDDAPSFLKQSQMGHIAPRVRDPTPPPAPIKAPVVIPPLPPIPDEPVRIPPTEEQKERRLKFLTQLREKNLPLRERRAIFLQQIKDQFRLHPDKLTEIHLLALGYHRGAPYALMRRKMMELLIIPPPPPNPIITCVPPTFSLPPPIIPLADFLAVFPSEKDLARIMRGLTCNKADKEQLQGVWAHVEKKRTEWERPYVFVPPTEAKAKGETESTTEDTEKEEESGKGIEDEKSKEKELERGAEAEKEKEQQQQPEQQLEQQKDVDTTMTDAHLTKSDAEIGMSFTDLLNERFGSPSPSPPLPTAEQQAEIARKEAEKARHAAAEAAALSAKQAVEAAELAKRDALEADERAQQAIRDYYEDTLDTSYNIASIRDYITFLLDIPTPGVVWGTRTLLDYAIDLFSFEAAVLRVCRDVAGPKRKKRNLEFIPVDIDVSPVRFSEEREDGRNVGSGAGGRGTPRGSARATPMREMLGRRSRGTPVGV